MGNISEHFSKEDFVCNCGECQKEFRMSLTLIGILEDVIATLNTKLIVVKGYQCDYTTNKEETIKKNYHKLGKALHITTESKEEFIKVFRYLERFPEITGLGINFNEKYIHIDLRDKEPYKYVIEKDQDLELTDALREKYELGEPVLRDQIPEPKTIETAVEI